MECQYVLNKVKRIYRLFIYGRILNFIFSSCMPSNSPGNNIYLALTEPSWRLFLKRLISSTEEEGKGLVANVEGRESSWGTPKIELIDRLSSPGRGSFWSKATAVFVSDTRLSNKLTASPWDDMEPALEALLLGSEDAIRFSAASRKLPGLSSEAATRCPLGWAGGPSELLEERSNLLLAAIIVVNALRSLSC